MAGKPVARKTDSPDDDTYTCSMSMGHTWSIVESIHAKPASGQHQARQVEAKVKVKDRHDDLSKTIQTVRRYLMWDRLTSLLPHRLSFFRPNPTVDHIVGMTLHCFALSIVVLTILAIRTSLACLRFACFLVLNVTIYKGKVTPIWTSRYKDQVTGDELRAATLFRVAGLALVITTDSHSRHLTGNPRSESHQRYGSRVAFQDPVLSAGPNVSDAVTSVSGHNLNLTSETSENSLLTHIFSRSSLVY